MNVVPGCQMARRCSLRNSRASGCAEPGHQRVHAARVTDEDELGDLDASRRGSVQKHIIQWYPGHIARAERQLKEQLSKVDIVFEVLDARIPRSTVHPNIKDWINNKRRFLLINRIDMVSNGDIKHWQEHYRSTGEQVYFVNGQTGDGVHKVIKAADALSQTINGSRTRRGLKPRPVRACVVGFPNIGKSALINRLTGRRVVESAAKPGVTRALRWVRMGEGLDLLDSPGIIPGAMNDQAAATHLAICNDIGEASYVEEAVAAGLLDAIRQLPDADAILKRMEKRYGVPCRTGSSEDFVWGVADGMFLGDPLRAGQRILADYRNLRLGPFALERPV